MDSILMTERALPQTVAAPAAKPKETAKKTERIVSEPTPNLQDSSNVRRTDWRNGPVQEAGKALEQQGQTREGKEAENKYQQVMTEKAVENANSRAHSMGTSAKFEYNDKINRITITISDKSSKEVIREVPPEETQKMLERIHMMRGVLMDAEV